MKKSLLLSSTVATALTLGVGIALFTYNPKFAAMLKSLKTNNQEIIVQKCSIDKLNEFISSSQYRNIIFDFGGVIADLTSDFTETQFGEKFNHIKELAIFIMKATKEEKKYFHQALPIPEVVYKWTRGFISSKEALEQTQSIIATNSLDEETKKKMLFCTDYIFKPELFAGYSLKLNQKVADIIISLATSHNTKNNLYVFSNLDKEILNELKKLYPNIFKHLTGTISAYADLGASKPDPESYAKMLEKFNLKAENCLFIDDKEINCKAALECGIASIQLINQ